MQIKDSHDVPLRASQSPSPPTPPPHLPPHPSITSNRTNHLTTKHITRVVRPSLGHLMLPQSNSYKESSSSSSSGKRRYSIRGYPRSSSKSVREFLHFMRASGIPPTYPEFAMITAALWSCTMDTRMSLRYYPTTASVRQGMA